LRDIEDLVGTYPTSDRRQEHLKTIVADLESLCKTLDKDLEKYAVLGQSSASLHDGKGKYLKNKLTVAWKRVRWDQSFIESTRQQLEIQFEALLSLQSSMNTVRIVNLASMQQKLQDSAEHKEFFQWLSSLNFGDKQKNLAEKRHPGTGEWLFGTEEFIEWSQYPQKTLFCQGIPGSGKTMMASLVIEYLLLLRQQDSKKGVAYIFQNLQASPQPSPRAQLLCILKQLLLSTGSITDEILILYHQLENENLKLSLEQTIELLKTTIKSSAGCFIVIDALDEYYLTEKPGLLKLVNILFDLQNLTDLNILVTSRPISEIQQLFGFSGCLSIAIQAPCSDIELYVDGRMKELTHSVFNDPEIQKDIKVAVSKASSGM
jgi:hypothetical protein